MTFKLSSYRHTYFINPDWNVCFWNNATRCLNAILMTGLSLHTRVALSITLSTAVWALITVSSTSFTQFKNTFKSSGSMGMTPVFKHLLTPRGLNSDPVGPVPCCFLGELITINDENLCTSDVTPLTEEVVCDPDDNWRWPYSLSWTPCLTLEGSLFRAKSSNMLEESQAVDPEQTKSNTIIVGRRSSLTRLLRGDFNDSGTTSTNKSY